MTGKSPDLGKDPIAKLVLSLAVPAMLAQFVNVLYSIVDRIYIGHIPEIGTMALAGVGVCGPLVTAISSFASWIGLGGAPLLTIRMGEKNLPAARAILANCFVLLAGVSVLLTAVVFCFKGSFLNWFGAGPNTFAYADEYLTWYAAGTIFAILSTGLNSFIVCQGHAKAGMLTVLVGAVTNIALDPLFIFGFGWNVMGAAVATVISQACSAAFTLIFLFGRRPQVRINFSGYARKIMGKVLLLGFSPFLIIMTDSVMILALNAVLQRYGGEAGDTLVTAATIVLSFMSLVTMPLGGITGGTQPILSFNYGAQNSARVKRGQAVILCACLIFTSVMFLVSRFGGSAFARIFTSDEEIISLTAENIGVYSMMIIPLAFQYAFVDGLTALGIAPAAISLSMFRKIVLMLPLTLLLPAFSGASAAFWAEPIADAAGSLVSTAVYLCLINRILRKREAVRVEPAGRA